MPKTCNKENCNYNVFGGGFCKSHQYLRVKSEKPKNDRGLFVREKEVVTSELPTAYELDKWFKARRLEMPEICESPNCNNKTYKHNEQRWKWSIAHILPKSPNSGCPSVSCHEYNCIFLCHSCHNTYDSSWDKAITMPIWALVKLKAQTFLHLVKEKRKFLDYFK